MSVKYESKISAILRNLPSALDQGLEDTAGDILDLAQQLCPVDKGELRDSGHVERRGQSWVVVFDAPYAAFVEYGTASSPAQPFLTPAARNVEPTTKVAGRIRKVLGQ